MSGIKTPGGWARVRVPYATDARKTYLRFTREFIHPKSSRLVTVRLEAKGYSRGELPGWIASYEDGDLLGMPSGDFAPSVETLAKRVERFLEAL